MILVFYGFLVIGLGLLILDVTGRLVVAPERARWWRWVGLALPLPVRGWHPLSRG